MVSEERAGTASLWSITNVFLQFARDHDLTVLASAADKHGSYVWEAAWQDDLTRYLTFSVTFLGTKVPKRQRLLPDDDGKMAALPALYYPCAFDVWVGADDGERYTGRVVSAWRYRREDQVVHTFPTTLETRLLEGLEEARTLTRADLTERYLVPREQWLPQTAQVD